MSKIEQLFSSGVYNFNSINRELLQLESDTLSSNELDLIINYAKSIYHLNNLHILFTNKLSAKKPNITIQLLNSIASAELDLDYSVHLRFISLIGKGNPYAYIFFIDNAPLNVIEVLHKYVNLYDVGELRARQYISLFFSYLPNITEIVDYNRLDTISILEYLDKELPLPPLESLSSQWWPFMNFYDIYTITTDGEYFYYTYSGLCAKLILENVDTLLYNKRIYIVFKNVTRLNTSFTEAEHVNDTLKGILMKVLNIEKIDYIPHNEPLLLDKCGQLSTLFLNRHPKKREVKSVIEYYISPLGFKKMHNYLKGVEDDDDIYDDIQESIEVLNNIIRESYDTLRGCSSRNIILYRGVALSLNKLSTPLFTNSIINNHVNQFISFSTDYSVAVTFSNDYLIYVLEVNMDTDIVLPLEHINEMEAEWLLPINTSFIVTRPPAIYNDIVHIFLKIGAQHEIPTIAPFTPDRLVNILMI
jgi:hypothetical protein